jgi:undecaprenyl-diphosphatase
LNLKLDAKITLALYNSVRRHKYVLKAASVVYRGSPLAFFIVYAAGGAWLYVYGERALFSYLAAPLCTILTSYGLRRLIKRARPYITLGLEPPEGGKAGYSCPSNHAASAGAIALALMGISPGFGACACVLALMTGLSRVGMGVHYLTDVLAGYALAGVFTVAAVIWML